MTHAQIKRWYESTPTPNQKFKLLEYTVVNPQSFWRNLGAFIDAGDKHEDWPLIHGACVEIMRLQKSGQMHGAEESVEL